MPALPSDRRDLLAAGPRRGEYLAEHLGLLGSRNRKRAVDHEVGNAADTSHPGGTILFDHSVTVLITCEVSFDAFLFETSFPGRCDEHILVPDIKPFGEIGSEQDFDQFVLTVLACGVDKEAVGKQRVGCALDLVEMHLKVGVGRRLGDVRVDRACARFPAKFRGKILPPVGSLERHIGVELEGMPTDLCFKFSLGLGECRLETALTDVAPGTDGVGVDIDGDAHVGTPGRSSEHTVAFGCSSITLAQWTEGSGGDRFARSGISRSFEQLSVNQFRLWRRKLMRIRLIPDDLSLQFIRWRHLAMGGSVTAVVTSLILFFFLGLNYGIDFRGGTLIEIRVPSVPAVTEIRSAFAGADLGEVAIQEFGAETDFLVRIERQPGGDEQQQRAVEEARERLGSAFGDQIDYRRVEFVGPTVSQDLLRDGAIAVVIAVVAMLLYIMFRFELAFAIGAVVALVHDVLLTVGVFSLTGLEFNIATVAALLLIVGYSMNDTVVVYDRVRENLRKYKKMPLNDLLDRSINETLSRTVNTTVTTILALGALILLGGPVIRDFSFAMVWGVLVGTYSSIFIAAPLLLTIGVHRGGPESEEASDKGVA